MKALGKTLAVLVFAALVLVGCGDGGDDPSSSSPYSWPTNLEGEWVADGYYEKNGDSYTDANIKMVLKLDGTMYWYVDDQLDIDYKYWATDNNLFLYDSVPFGADYNWSNWYAGDYTTDGSSLILEKGISSSSHYEKVGDNYEVANIKRFKKQTNTTN